MSVALLLEFETEGDAKALYEAVSRDLGLEPGVVPPGALSHTAGLGEDGAFIVYEVWSSREAQGSFMEDQLMPALQKNNAPAPSRMTWIDLFADDRA